MGQFKPMVKMYTTEPSVELKLKKGGHVKTSKMKVKEHDGHKMMDGGVPPMGMPARGGLPTAAVPMKPSLAMRRKAMRAMSPAAPAGPVGMAGRMMKKGGKAEGGESSKEHMAEMRMMKKTEKELKHHEAMPASKAHKGLKKGGACAPKMKKGGKCFADGGEIDRYDTRDTVEGNEGKYDKTMVHEGKPDRRKGKTGEVKEGQGGYKRGGKVMCKATGGAIPDEETYGKYQTTEVHQAGPQREKGPTGGVTMGQGGFKKGGRCYADGGKVMNYVDGNVVGTPAGKTNTTTGGVRESNAGGFKKGGRAKKMAEGGASKKAVDGAKSGMGTVTEVERQIVRKMTPKKPNPYDSRNVQSNDVTPMDSPISPEFLKEYMKTPHYKKGGKTKYADGGMVQGAPMGLPSVSPTGRVGLPPVSASGRIYDPYNSMLAQQPGGQPMPVGYATGGSVQDDGRAVKMPKPRVPTPVSINQLSGTYKKGGRVK
jgi:hypothetical protein